MQSSRPQITDATTVAAKSPVPVLVVDDNASKRLALNAVLSPLGFSIVEADSGEAALRCVMAQDFAVILLDVKMPGMDGFETAALIRRRRQSKMTPIIFITSYSRGEIATSARYVEGAVDFMFAPVQPDELRAKVSVFAKLFTNAEELAARAREVQTSADQLRLLTDAAPIGIFQTDSQERYVYTNPRWTEITGIPADEAAGRDWSTIIGSEQRADLIAELPDDGPDPAGPSRRFEIRRPGAASRIVLVTSESIPDTDGGSAGWVGTLADVTAEAGAEAAMSDARDKATGASQQKSDFLANMSHEIRTPMNGVIGMTELLLETDLDARQRDYALTVATSGEALLTIINDILDFSKVEAGKLEIENIEYNLRTTVDDVVALLATPAQTKGLELETVFDGSVPDVVRGDPGRVRQVLTNLIGNAIKFTQAGAIVVRVAVAEVDGADTLIRFEVSDTGDGIAPDKLAMIFQPFIQADASTSRKYGGTGLGLAISGQLVALMGGDCGVSSRLGAGSEFWFTIRVQAQAQPGDSTPPSPDDGAISAPIGDDRPGLNGPARASPAEPSAAVAADGILDTPPATAATNGHKVIRSRPAGSTPSVDPILVAEDNPVNQRVAAAMLENLGFSVEVVPDGAEAVKAASLKPYQAILMDCQMPVLDGYEATREIRRTQKSPRTPIIAVTASAMKSDQERCLAAGMDDYLAKPLSLKALSGVLARWAPGEAGPEVADSVERPPVPDGPSPVGPDALSVGPGALSVGPGAASVGPAFDPEPASVDPRPPRIDPDPAAVEPDPASVDPVPTPVEPDPASVDPVQSPVDGLPGPVDPDPAPVYTRPAPVDGHPASIDPDPASVDPTSASVNPDPAVLDDEVVGRLARLGEESGEDLLGQLATIFLADAEVQVASLRQALGGDDAAAVAKAAHTLSGAGANLGATDLAEVCAALSKAGATGDLEGGAALLETVEVELERLRSTLDSWTPTT